METNQRCCVQCDNGGAESLDHITVIEKPDSVGQFSWRCTSPVCDEAAGGYEWAAEVTEAATAHGPLAAGSFTPVDAEE